MRKRINFLKNERGICFEDIISCILNDKLLSIVEHKNPDKYPG